MPQIEAIVIYLLISFCSGEESSLVKLSSVESLASSSSLHSCLAWLCVACDSVIRVESGCVLAVRAL